MRLGVEQARKKVGADMASFRIRDVSALPDVSIEPGDNCRAV
jgi:hypothetical protein